MVERLSPSSLLSSNCFLNIEILPVDRSQKYHVDVCEKSDNFELALPRHPTVVFGNLFFFDAFWGRKLSRRSAWSSFFLFFRKAEERFL